MRDEQRALLAAGCGRGFTIVCLLADTMLLDRLAAIAGTTGRVIAAGPEPSIGVGWATLRCNPGHAIPIRAHVVDAALLPDSDDLAAVAEETRRVLTPGGDVRVLTRDAAGTRAALATASIRTLSIDACGVLVARGP